MNSELEAAIIKCLAETLPKINEEVLKEFSETPEDRLFLHHFGLGLYLRNNVLTPECELHKLFIQAGITHKDDMSSEMIRLWYTAVSGETAQKNVDSAGRRLP